MTNTWIIAATGAGIAQIAESAGEDANLLVVGGGDSVSYTHLRAHET